MITHIDLFSGLGGMTLALKNVSRPVAYCDCCPIAIKLLQKHMIAGQLPKAPLLKDVCTFNQDIQLTAVDIITAGFPCQGFSKCGKRLGFHDARSRLFFDMLKVIRKHSPKLVFLENVTCVGLPQNLKVITEVFAKLGYQLIHKTFHAHQVGLPHQRSRWFGIAHKGQHKFMQVVCDKLQVSTPGKQPQRTKQSPTPGAGVRWNLLKNSVIPSCAAHAYKHLLLYHLYGQQFKSSASIDLKLVFKQNNVVIHKKLWPTLFGNWRHGSKLLTERVCGDLPTAIKFETHTSHGHVSFAFLEWLMGYPTGWSYAD